MTKNSNLQLAQVWDDFCDQLKASKDVVFRDMAPKGERDRAAGIRMLARTIALALDFEYENADPLHPELTHVFDWRRKAAGDNPDSLYLWTPINGSDTYRVSGTRGSASFVAFTVMETGGTPWGGSPVAYLFNHTMHVEPDGRFEVILSPEPPQPQPKNWLKTTPKTYRMMVRQFFNDWENEQPMKVRIDRLGDPVPPPDITSESLATGLRKTVEWLKYDSIYWAEMLEMWQKRPLEYLSFHQLTNNSIDATPGGVPLMCYWEMAADEALIIRVEPPRNATFWNFEFGNWWLETMDYRNRLAGTNGHYAVLEDNGELIQVLSHDDPGVPNWVDASGFSSGYGVCRWMGADSAPQPKIERVKRADLFKHLPPTIKRIDTAGRQVQLAARRRGVMQRFAGF